MQISSFQLCSGRRIGQGSPTYIIAEIGSNHDGELSRAKKLLHLAKEAGADAAKFQSFTAEGLINRLSKQQGVWKQNPAWDIIKRLSLPREWHQELALEAKRIGIDFLSTPFDLERLQLLLELNVPAIKIASGDLSYYDLIKAAGASGKPVILSTGHATLGEVERALNVLKAAGGREIVVLHCASLYPSGFKDAHIPAMQTMQQAFHVLVGYSDHTPGSVVPLGAVALGACVIEKHFTDDCSRPGPDHAFALDFQDFSRMVTEIRQLEAALVWAPKTFREGEVTERIMARRALYAAETIPQGSRLSDENVKCVRQAYPEGIPANEWATVKGRPVSEEIPAETLITWEKISW